MKLAIGVLAIVAVGCSPVRASSNKVAAKPPIQSSPSTTVPTTTTSVDPTTTIVDSTTAPTTVAPTTIAPTTIAAPVATVPKPTAIAAGSGFEQCVIVRESGGDPHVGSGGLYGILPSTWHSLGRSGTAGSASPAEQKAAFDQLYAKYGKQPWGPFDGCR